MFCPNCGNNIPDNSQFCTHCGMQFRMQSGVQPKTRLGITVGMLGAVTCFSALVDPIILALLAVYILFVEKDKWLKALAIKISVVYMGFFVILQAVNIINLALSSFTNFTNYWFATEWYPQFPGMLTNIINIARIVTFVVAGISALKMKGFRINKIDSYVENNL